MTIDAGKQGAKKITGLSLIDPTEEMKRESRIYEHAAGMFALKYVNTGGEDGFVLPSTRLNLKGGWQLELERFEALPVAGNACVFNLVLSVCRGSDEFRKLDRKYKILERRSVLLKKEIKKLDALLNQMEEIKESFRIPFDALKNLVISFDHTGNILVVNEASREWFGQSPKEVAKKKCTTLFNRDIPEIIRQVCESNETVMFEENIDGRALQISCVPMDNKKRGDTEVVMIVQDITESKMAEEERIKHGRNEGVSLMGGTIRHILNSSLTAILGFSQLALSTYDWPRETMIKYLKLIERTALRMKMEINKIAEQKEYRAVKYLDMPGAEDCSEILEIEMDGEQ